jgi:hypothetical protein
MIIVASAVASASAVAVVASEVGLGFSPGIKDRQKVGL